MLKKQPPILLLLTALLIALSHSYTLEGKWSLRSISSRQTPASSKNLNTQIDSFIFRGTQVRNKLKFNTCYPIYIQF